MPSKAALRAELRAARERATPAERAARDRARLTHLLQLASGHSAVACYLSVPPEPDTTVFVDALHARGVRVLLPLLRGRRTPAWAWYAGPGTLVPGWRGIPEPGPDASASAGLAGPASERPVALEPVSLGSVSLGSVSLVVTSALAATVEGVRLGVGGGWYDRALPSAAAGCVTAAVLDAAAVLDTLPRDPWDVTVDVLVTEHGLVPTRPAGR
ncbi:5-formyltetrahydrofolate cyclo-ligase [Propioniciclava soli]|uniref:5-formyltetrahydrofolate cyclo-ligase n=1 Tax=Propioniciclava soli TaxID=2775081 RepID=UPI001E42C518|nr:5-formyltetrahydrofolate cyclo-ligase [Propioniciclava soli]